MLELEFLRSLAVLDLAPEGHRSDLHLLELVEPSLYLRPLLLGLELLLRAAGEGPYVVQCRLSLERHQCLLLLSRRLLEEMRYPLVDYCLC